MTYNIVNNGEELSPQDIDFSVSDSNDNEVYSDTELRITLSPSTEGIDEIDLIISLAAGAPTQDLRQTLIRVYSDEGQVSLKAGDTANHENYSYEPQIKPEGGGDTPYVESGDKYKITINLTAKDQYGEPIIGALGPQDKLDIQVIPKHGEPTYENIVAPPTITGKMISL